MTTDFNRYRDDMYGDEVLSSTPESEQSNEKGGNDSEINLEIKGIDQELANYVWRKLRRVLKKNIEGVEVLYRISRQGGGESMSYQIKVFPLGNPEILLDHYELIKSEKGFCLNQKLHENALIKANFADLIMSRIANGFTDESVKLERGKFRAKMITIL